MGLHEVARHVMAVAIAQTEIEKGFGR
jgi:hypothetical protein